ncbi:MAG: chorismate lyase [Alcaligenaceae bacterium]
MQKHRDSNKWWQQPAPLVSSLQREWLTRGGALTEALRQVGRLHLRVLSEKVCRFGTEEALRLGLVPGQPAWQREVCMSLNGQDCVVAHSVTTLQASLGCWQAMKRLRNRPLADILYQDRSIIRSGFEFGRIKQGMPLAKRIQALQSVKEITYARRSVFWRARQPLLVVEAFLPNFWLQARNQRAHRSLIKHLP